MNFDMNRTWSQAVALVRANFQLLAIIAGVFLLLPALAFYLLNPELVQVLAAGENTEQVDALVEGMMPGLLIYGLVVFIGQMIGQAALVALVGRHRPTVGEAIKLGARVLPSLVGALIVFLVGIYVVALVLSLVVALVAALLGTSASGGAFGGFTAIVLLVIEVYLMIRCMMALPVIVLEHQLNPIKALRRSWRLTSTHAWKILGFVLLLGIVYFVIVLLIMLVLGAIGLATGGDPASQQLGPGSAAGFAVVASVMGALVAMLTSGILVSMHRQLAGASEPRDVEFDA
jgi:hypothetical protein